MTDDPPPQIPDELPVEEIDMGDMVSPIVEANKALARFDGQLEGIQNPRVLLSPLMTQEAVVSSKIERTQATLEDVLEHEADQGQPEEQSTREDVEEIINYRSALSYGEQQMADRPFNLNLLKEMHAILMDGVREPVQASWRISATADPHRPSRLLDGGGYIHPSAIS